MTTPTPKGFWRTTGLRRIAVGLVVLLAIPAAAYAVGRRAATLEESVLNATPPPRREIVATVEEKVVGSLEVFRASLIRPDVPLTVSFPDPVVLMSISPPVGDMLTEGSVVAVVDDRPLVVLAGDLPLIHELAPGDTGTMVVQLQRSLARVDLYRGEIDGRYGPRTRRAVDALFDAAGFPDIEGGVSPESVVFVPGLPAPVAEVTRQVGDVLEGDVELLRLSAGEPVIEVRFGGDDASIFQVGMSAMLRDVRTDKRFPITLDEIVDDTETGPDRRIARFHSVTGNLAGVDDTDITVEVDLRPSDQPSLVVPSTGVYADASGTTYVLKASPNGSERVLVEVLFAANGEAAVQPLEGSLAAGDGVVVGMAEGG